MSRTLRRVLITNRRLISTKVYIYQPLWEKVGNIINFEKARRRQQEVGNHKSMRGWCSDQSLDLVANLRVKYNLIRRNTIFVRLNINLFVCSPKRRTLLDMIIWRSQQKEIKNF